MLLEVQLLEVTNNLCYSGQNSLWLLETNIQPGPQPSEGLLLMDFLISHFSDSHIGQSLHSAEVLQAPSKRPLEKTA